MKKKLLVLCPHPDDEIFTFNQIKQFSEENHEIYALFFTENKIRRKEAKISCYLNKWNILFASDYGYKFSDGKIHLKYKKLDSFILKIIKDFKIIISPAIEGGHQDHDTIGFNVFIKALEKKDKEFYFYTTYTALGKFGLYLVMSKSNYADSLFVEDKTLSSKINLKSILFFFKVYKSQLKAGLLLLIPWIIQFLLNKNICTYTIKKKSYINKNKIIYTLKGIPLYEIHRRCTKREWISNINSLNQLR